MSSDKNSNTNPGSRGMADNDKEYYEDLYNDLPKEVVDILMQTHPLMSKDGNTEPNRSRKRPSREDIEEVREARMQQVGTEINEIKKAPQQEGEPTRYVSRRARSTSSLEDTNNPVSVGNRIEQDEYDDGIQYVSVMPSRKKSKIAEDVSQQTLSPAKRKKSRKEDNAFEDFTPKGRNRFEELDFEEKAKQEHLDSLYDDYDDYDDAYDFRGGVSKLGIILGVMGLILIVFLIFKCVSLNSKLEDAQNQLTANVDLSSKYESVQLEKMQLEEQLANLQNPDVEGNTPEGEETQPPNTPEGNANTTGNNGTTTEYVVQEGDTAWSIAQKVYGNGTEYKKILDANNLKETDTIGVGTKLKIPR
ncbi:LysM domain/BON superfamily protein [Anaerotignum neopropionicum]|uniref:LysM domain/BON superfamily protein n=1 Tax=Anaerotignum neopropionicum TaxID=36847 RepID=A0A136WH73_9FIRM|nr:LysM peptidoglycan-binding domain-containing protein [Anaerotignum neopropionicum]KXL53918.1 LysM domain/BON superfamily protein [Anaerotignum neopropionicum]